MSKPFAGILGFGHALPESVRTNEDPVFDDLRKLQRDGDKDCAAQFDGYEKRRVLRPGETAEELAVQAGRAALAHAGIDAPKVDLLVGATSVGDYVSPNGLAAVHRDLELRADSMVLPLDVHFNTFNAALLTATAMVEAGRVTTALVVCAADWTRHVDYKACESLSVGDGAGACVVGLTQNPGFFGRVDDVTLVESSGYGAMYMALSDDPRFHITEEGGRLFETFGIRKPGEAADLVLRRNGLTGSEIGLVSHQASAVLMKAWGDRVQPRVYIESLKELANMTIASIPVNLSRSHDDIRKLDHLLLLGIGIEFQTSALLLGRGGIAQPSRRPPTRRAAGSTMPAPRGSTVTSMLLHYLKLEEVTHVFGVPGGAAKTVLNALKERSREFTYVVCRHETGAAFMADGYARVSGGLGVVLVTSGPGGTNALTGALNAQSSGVSLLTITGEPPSTLRGRGYLQEGVDAGLDMAQVYRNAVASSDWILNGESAQTQVAGALRVARSEPLGGAHLSLPDDIAQEPLPSQAVLPTTVDSYRARPKGISPRETDRAFDRFLEAEFPLFLLGNGCRRAFEKPGGQSLVRFKRLVEDHGIPVVTTPDAKGIFPESHELSLRVFGTAGCIWPQHYMQHDDGRRFDALFVLASALGDFSTARFSENLQPDGPIFQVDLNDEAIGRAYPVDLGIVAGVEGTIWQLHERKRSPVAAAVRARRERVKAIKDQHPPWRPYEGQGDPGGKMLPQELMRGLNAALPEGSQIFVDSGNCVGWCVHYLAVDPPTTVRPALDMGPMGFGIGAVVGAALAAPDRLCAAVVGDGSFLMHGAEISTAARYGLAPVVIVLEDGDLNMVSQGMNQFYGGGLATWRAQYHLGDPDLAAFARSLGAEVHELHAARDVEKVMPEVVAAVRSQTGPKRPQVVVARVDPAQIPPYYPSNREPNIRPL